MIISLCVLAHLILKHFCSFGLTNDKIQVDNSMLVGLYYELKTEVPSETVGNLDFIPCLRVISVVI